eukprot:207344-Chlamydomonas_euryale.AAC.1
MCLGGAARWRCTASAPPSLSLKLSHVPASDACPGPRDMWAPQSGGCPGPGGGSISPPNDSPPSTPDAQALGEAASFPCRAWLLPRSTSGSQTP